MSSVVFVDPRSQWWGGPFDPGFGATPLRCHIGSPPSRSNQTDWVAPRLEEKPWTCGERVNERHGALSCRRGLARTPREATRLASQGNPARQAFGNGRRSGAQARPTSSDACRFRPNVSPRSMPANLRSNSELVIPSKWETGDGRMERNRD
eukprot:scaffold633_cov321-Pavlova_lutheri.AAC.6